MASLVEKAIRSGFTSRQILNYVSQKYPNYAPAVNAAYHAGFTPENILRKIVKPESGETDNEDFLTEHERTIRNDKRNKRKAAQTAIGALGTAGAVAATAYGLSQRNSAIQPSEILPAEQKMLPPGSEGQTINAPPRRPRGPGGGTQSMQAPKQLGYNPQVSPAKSSSSPIKAASTIPSVAEFDEPSDIPEVRQLQRRNAEIKDMWQMAEKGKTGGKPFLKVATKLVRTGDITDINTFGDFYKWWNATESQERGGPLVEFEKFRVQRRQMYEPQEAQSQPQEQPQMQQMAEMPQQTPEQAPIEQEAVQPRIPINERIREAAFGEHPELKPLVETSMQGKEFSIPTYRMPSESQEDFSTRKIINEAIKKTAKALQEGKNFLDLPISKEIVGKVGSYSTAEDVLRLMAGIPNVYDPLLDEEEKQELFTGLMESGGKSVEGLRPTEGERDIYGAQMSPNLVWNMLLSVEPRLLDLKRAPAMKGIKKPGQAMDTTAYRRYLTHSVYGVLSGKNISPELADKINKISNATSKMDVLVKAAQEGKFNAVLREMETMMNDEYFFGLFTDEVDQMASGLGVGRMDLQGYSSADTRYANELKKKMEARKGKADGD
jgi:hypothetical protein